MPHVLSSVLASASDLIFPLIFVLIFVVTWISKAISSVSNSSKNTSMSGHQKTTFQSQTRPTASSSEPQNLSMAERIERARAKAQYEARSQQLRSSSSASSAQTPSQSAHSPSAPTQKQQAAKFARQRRQHAQQQATQMKRQAVQQRAASKTAQTTTPHQSAAAASASSAKPLDAYRQDARRRAHVSLEAQAAAIAAQSPAATEIGSKPRRDSQASSKQAIDIRAGLGSPAALRKAFVLKEILDKPLALRDPLPDGIAG